MVGSVGLSLLFAASVLNAAWLAKRLSAWVGMLGFGALWAAIDYLLSFNATGSFPAFLTQAGAPAAIQTAAYFGPWMVSFLLGAVSAALALAFRQKSPSMLALAAILFVANLGFGAWRLWTAPAAETLRIGLAVSDSDNAAGEIADRAKSQRVLDRYGNATRTLAAQGAQLIVVPEEAARLEPQWREDFLTVERERALQNKADLVMGFRDHAGNLTRNIALTFPKDGSAPQSYAKRHLIPGAEAPLVTPGNIYFARPDRIGVAICKDMDFPQTLRADIAAGHSNLMIVPAWDFDRDGWAHARFAILRSVENGFSMARAARHGLLTLNDGYGRLIAARKSAPGMVTLVGDLPRGPGNTVYTKIGDVFAWFAMAALLLMNVAALPSKKRLG
jgi:apolipoprotein N-acyltransferase